MEDSFDRRIQVATTANRSRTMGDAVVGLPIGGSVGHHHRSQSNPAPSFSGSRESTLGADPWRYKTVTPSNQTLDRRRQQLARSAPTQQPRGTPPAKGAPKLEISPFSRSRSRIFYASEDLYNVEQPPKTTPVVAQRAGQSVPQKPPDTSVPEVFARDLAHRTSSGRKSHDSGFSDCGDRTPTGSKKSGGGSPAKKLPKWSSSFPIKALLKAQDLSGGQQALPKLALLKCCIGIGPNPYCKDRKVRGFLMEQPTKNIDDDSVQRSPKPPNLPETSPALPVPNGTTEPTKSNSDGMGTWPRRRRNKEVEADSAAPAKPSAYFSTRVRGNQRFRGKSVDSARQPIEASNGPVGRGMNASCSRLTDTIRNSSLQQWSTDMKWTTEDECMNTLQGKTVVRDVADVIAMANRNAKDTILMVHGKCAVVNEDLEKLKRKIEKTKFSEALSMCDRIASNIDSLLWSCKVHQGNESAILQYHRLVSVHCSILIQLFERVHRGELSKEDCHSLHDTIYALKSAVTSLSEALILIHIRSIVDILEEPPNLFNLKSAVSSVEALGNHHISLCRNISSAGGIRALLTVCVDPRYKSVRGGALRSLATLCCVSESIQEVEEAGGVECITEILIDKMSSEEEKREAAGFIAQLTSPALENNHRIDGLAENLRSLVQSLTSLAKLTQSSDSFLLATAALANLTFMTNSTSHYLHQAKTVYVLVLTCRKVGDKKAGSVFVKDQVATVLANMSSLPEGRKDVIESGGLEVLLSFLQIKPCSATSKAELGACERVQQKSSIALSRLCSDVAVSEQVIRLQGVQRLVQLCKDEKERNQSDAVLVACLAVLRKIATACGFEEFKGLDAMELVKPRLLDTFLIYSSRQESYV